MRMQNHTIHVTMGAVLIPYNSRRTCTSSYDTRTVFELLSNGFPISTLEYIVKTSGLESEGATRRDALLRVGARVLGTSRRVSYK